MLLTKTLRVMRITAFLLVIFSLHLGARSVSQTVSYSGTNVPIKAVLIQVKMQTGYRVAYNEDQLVSSKPVTINTDHAPLQEFLHMLSEDQPFDFVVRKQTIFLVAKAKAATPVFFVPPVTIHGRVTDSAGKALVGATVQVKGTRQVAVTDANGSFVIGNVKDDAIIVISFVGYGQQQVMVKGKSEINVQLSPAVSELENVEVALSNGYQKIPRERATGSFDFIDNKKFNEQVSANVLDRLEGIASGLSIDRNVTANAITHKTGITIRGISTIGGFQDPLIILDNFPYDGDLSNINPNNVENITILKDAAAASIWGAKAGNGVIVITTKRGKFGQKMRVAANANISVTNKPNLFAMRLISSKDFIGFERSLFNAAYFDSRENNTYSYPVLSPAVEIFIKQRDHLITDDQAAAQLDSLGNHDIRNDFEKYIYRTAVHKQAAVNLTGGTNNTSYSLFAGYDKDISSLNAGTQRINLGSMNTFKPLKNIEINTSIQFTQTDNSPGGRTPYGVGGYGYSSLPSYVRLADSKGNALPVYTYRQSFIDTLGQGKLLDWNYYPLNDWEYIHNQTNQTDFLVNTSIGYQLTSALRLSFDYKYERQRTNQSTLDDQQSYFARDIINTYTQLQPDGSSPTYIVPLGDIKYLQDAELSSNQFRGQLVFDKSWNKHTVSLLAAAEAGSTSSSNHTGNPIYGFDPDNLSSVPVDIVNSYPSIINQGYTPIVTSYEGFSSSAQRFVSILANAAYTYEGKYTFSGSARRDGANIFGATTNNRWKPLWSTGISWDISKEDFYRSNLFSFLKFRATYGYEGNLMPDAIGVTSLSAYGLDYYQRLPRFAFITYNNPDLRWENVAMLNIGFDFSTRKNIIAGSLEYFRKKTSNLFGNVQTDYTTIPVTLISRNVASTAGNGVDLRLVTKNIDRKIRWSTILNASWYKDRTISYYLPGLTANNFISGAALSPGGRKAVYGVYAYRWAGLNPQTGDPQGYIDGKVSMDYSAIANDSAGRVRYFGSASPTFYGSIANNVEWNSFSLSVNIIYRLGYYFHRPSVNYYLLAQNGTGSSDYAARWIKPGDELHTSVPSMAINNNDRDNFYGGSEILVDKGDQIRLNYIRLNYSLQPKWMSRIGLSAASVYINSSNLGIIWRANKDGVDPDYPNVQSVKPSKTISFGFNASF